MKKLILTIATAASILSCTPEALDNCKTITNGYGEITPSENGYQTYKYFVEFADGTSHEVPYASANNHLDVNWDIRTDENGVPYFITVRAINTGDVYCLPNL